MNATPATPNASPDNKPSKDALSRDHAKRMRDHAVGIVRTLTKRDYIAYFAGGCVRDEIMGSVPSDFDVATNATPDQVQQIFGRSQSLMIGACFGVVCVHQRIDGISHQVEVATFRSDGEYIDGRRPESVAFTSPELDAQRRDFTINGMFYDPISEKVIDFVDGSKDILSKTIRAIGDPLQRFAEDRLRLLRAVRFASRFGFVIEPNTLHAVRNMASRITEVSSERIATEVRKMFSDPRGRIKAITLLDETGLLEATLPEAADVIHRDVATRNRTLQRVGRLDSKSWIAVTVGLLWEDLESKKLDSSEFASILKSRWQLSNQEEQEFRFVFKAQQWLCRAESSPWSQLQPLLLSPYIDSALSLTESLREVSSDIDNQSKSIARLREVLAQDISTWNPRPFVDGSLLMELAIPVGPLYTTLIRLARDAQLDGLIQSREDARQWIRQLIEQST